MSIADRNVENRMDQLLQAITSPTITLSLLIHAPGIESKLGEIMAALDDLKTAVANLNTSVSDEIAAVAAAIKNAAGTGSVSAADAEAIVTQLQGIKKTLDAETASLTTPAPVPSPAP